MTGDGFKTFGTLGDFKAIRSEEIARRLRSKPELEELSDGELLNLSDKGSEDAFLILFRRHEGSVFRFALHMSGRRETAEEVTQEVFLMLLRKHKRYTEERGGLQAYLIGAARNIVRRHLIKDRISRARMLDGRSAIKPNLDEELSRDQELEALRAAILRLPVNYREVVVLCELENASYAEAAHQLGCAIGTVRSRLHRARAILAAKLRRGERCPA
ncbi:MAG: sigma-70 family RNA polymerase sigma factor [Acidobacteriaceae bacterium]|nr:sigma-70 family RNA polymerase sigma factor [Acidobacteriaceae bacterium]MBV9778986.1 sigma-70 family RNA polymerase sigma factor [Acidobacteriaceae bacterium]